MNILNKKMVLFLVIAVMIVAGGFFIWQKAGENLLFNYNDLNNKEKEAVITGMEKCQEFQPGNDQDLCFFDLAIESVDESLCVKVGELELLKDCQEKLGLKNAISGGNMAECQKLEKEDYQIRCVSDQIYLKDSNVDCSVLSGSIQSFCLDEKNYYLAMAGAETANCNLISDANKRTGCIAKKENIAVDSDEDRDGLVLYEEVQNNTNPKMADSDNDGFFDKAEIDGGFDPLGPGKLDRKEVDKINCYDLKDSVLKEGCIAEFVNAFFDINYCEAVKDFALRQYCQELFRSANGLGQ